MKRIILIGGSGFLGSHVLKALLDSEHEIYAVEHKTSVNTDKEVHIVKGGIKAVCWRKLNEIKPDIILHCARPSIPRFKRYGRLMAARYAAHRNRLLIRQLKHSKYNPKLIFASGSLMYGNSNAAHDESAPIKPFSYARQYFRGEKPILRALNKKTYPIQILRFPWLLGDGSWFKWFFLQSVIDHQAVPLFGEGSNLMEILDVQDAARLMVRYAMEIENPGIYNIPSKDPISQLVFAESTAKVFEVAVKNYSEIFSGKLEKEALEAFTSNILLKTSQKEILNSFEYTSLSTSLTSGMGYEVRGTGYGE